MPRHTFAFSIALLAIAAWVAAVPLQAGTNVLRRELYGPATAEFFGPYLEDHGPREEAFEGQSSKGSASGGSAASATTTGTGTVATELSRTSTDRARYLRGPSDRLGRNLDQIGGGNLLRRGQLEREPAYDSPRWLAARRNLDQIGGGNLLRDVNDRLDRNLDQIGGGNLVRGLEGGANLANNFRRNLDQIGGGNLVRGLAEAMVREIARDRAVESRSYPRSRYADP